MPARKPNAVKAAKGTLRSDRTKKNVPKLRSCAVPPPPAGLTPTQRRIWLELTAAVELMQVFSSANLTSFRLLVKSVALAEDACGVDSPFAPSAQARLIQSAASQLASYGLTPVSRETVSRVPKSAADGQAEREDEDDADIFSRPVPADVIPTNVN